MIFFPCRGSFRRFERSFTLGTRVLSARVVLADGMWRSSWNCGVSGPSPPSLGPKMGILRRCLPLAGELLRGFAVSPQVFPGTGQQCESIPGRCCAISNTGTNTPHSPLISRHLMLHTPFVGFFAIPLYTSGMFHMFVLAVACYVQFPYMSPWIAVGFCFQFLLRIANGCLLLYRHRD